MAVDDVAKLWKEDAKGRAIIGVLNVFVDRVEEPESRVGGVVKAVVFAFRKHVGDKAVANVVGKSTQDISSFRVSSRWERQSFEADHGVAAPVGEPVIACDH